MLTGGQEVAFEQGSRLFGPGGGITFVSQFFAKVRFAGSNPVVRHCVMSQDIGNGRTCDQGSACFVFLGPVGASWPTDGCSGAVVATVGVDGEGADDLAGGGVDDADVVDVDGVRL